jgi:uncharacterized cupredoxin-like copper-binding protein
VVAAAIHTVRRMQKKTTNLIHDITGQDTKMKYLSMARRASDSIRSTSVPQSKEEHRHAMAVALVPGASALLSPGNQSWKVV